MTQQPRAGPERAPCSVTPPSTTTHRCQITHSPLPEGREGAQSWMSRQLDGWTGSPAPRQGQGTVSSTQASGGKPSFGIPELLHTSGQKSSPQDAGWALALCSLLPHRRGLGCLESGDDLYHCCSSHTRHNLSSYRETSSSHVKFCACQQLVSNGLELKPGPAHSPASSSSLCQP